MTTFRQSLQQGRVAEGLIARWLMARGSSVMPAYEIEVHQYKGPQLFSAEGEFVAPDMLAFSRNGIHWIEAKHKSVFTWHRKTAQWTTGIDLHHYEQYQRVARITALPVWLLFYHRERTPAPRDRKHNCPAACPVGLFGGSLDYLTRNENHRTPHLDASRGGVVGHGRSGMVYWAEGRLKLLATVEQVQQVLAEAA